MSPRKPASTCTDKPRGCRPPHVCLPPTMCVMGLVLLCGASALAWAQGVAQSTARVTARDTTSSGEASDTAMQQAALMAVKRVCVATLTGDEKFAQQVQEMLISSLFAAKRFRVTENCAKADATLKGTATENKEVASRYEDEGIGFGESAGGVRGSWNQSGGSVSGGAAGVAGLASETLASSSVKNSTNLAVRLVNTDGEVIWATTQESTGSKMKGPAADLADRAVKQLVRDLDKAVAPPSLNPK